VSSMKICSINGVFAYSVDPSKILIFGRDTTRKAPPLFNFGFISSSDYVLSSETFSVLIEFFSIPASTFFFFRILLNRCFYVCVCVHIKHLRSDFVLSILTFKS
jgi:hypothetical protein